MPVIPTLRMPWREDCCELKVSLSYRVSHSTHLEVRGQLWCQSFPSTLLATESLCWPGNFQVFSCLHLLFLQRSTGYRPALPPLGSGTFSEGPPAFMASILFTRPAPILSGVSNGNLEKRIGTDLQRQ